MMWSASPEYSSGDGDVPLSVCAPHPGAVLDLVIAESAYVMTGKVIYKDITRFWGKLFGINFVMG